MRNGVHERLADRGFRVFGDVGAQQAVDARRRGDAAHDVRLSLVDHLDDRPIELLVIEKALSAPALLLLVNACVLHEGDHELRLELLWVAAEDKQAAKCRAQDALDVADDTECHQRLVEAGPQDASPRSIVAELIDEGCEALGVEVLHPRLRNDLAIETRLRARTHVAEYLVRGHALG